MDKQDYIDSTSNTIMDTYGRFPVVLEKGHGATLFDTDGKKYIDFGSGIGVTALGHCDDGWVTAITNQAKTLGHISNLYYTPVMSELAEKLTAVTGMAKAFFCNSGAEANEGAIKLARKYSSQKYSENRTNIITLKNSFHGRTVTTLAATGQDSFHKFFMPFTEGFLYAARNMNSVKELYNDTVCAVMIELIQGEGGVFPLDKEFVSELDIFCKENDLLLIVDEVQTGVMRTGAFLCCENYGISPSIVTLAKGLGGGLPFGAFLCNEDLKDVLAKGDHGSTFGANPVCCAGALEVLKRLSDKTFCYGVIEKGEYIKNKLKSMGNVGEIRGMGLMLGFDVKKGDSKELVSKMAEKGLLCLTAKTAVRFLPPLIISYREIDEGLEILKSVLEDSAE